MTLLHDQQTQERLVPIYHSSVAPDSPNSFRAPQSRLCENVAKVSMFSKWFVEQKILGRTRDSFKAWGENVGSWDQGLLQTLEKEKWIHITTSSLGEKMWTHWNEGFLVDLEKKCGWSMGPGIPKSLRETT